MWAYSDHNSLFFSPLRLSISLLLPSWRCSSRFPDCMFPYNPNPLLKICALFHSFTSHCLLSCVVLFLGFPYFPCFCCIVTIVWVLFALCGAVLDLVFWVWSNFMLLWICRIVFELFLDYGFCLDLGFCWNLDQSFDFWELGIWFGCLYLLLLFFFFFFLKGFDWCCWVVLVCGSRKWWIGLIYVYVWVALRPCLMFLLDQS